MPPGKPQPGRIEPGKKAGQPQAQDLVRAKKTTPAKLLERDKWGKQERWQTEFETTGGKVALSTDVGRVRGNNQDAIGAVENNGVALFVLCDGVGGRGFGEVASGLASMRAIKTFERSDDPINFNLQENINATEKSFTQAKKERNDNFISDGGTTFTAVRVEGNKMEVDTLADSGVMVIRQGQIVFITRPEHAAQRYYERKKCSPEEAIKNTYNVISQHVGDPTEKPGSAVLNHSEFNLKKGDKVIMYSDGLTDPYFKIVPVDADGNTDYAALNAMSEVQKIIIESQTSRDPGEINAALTNMSLDDKSKDNVSVITYIHEGVVEAGVDDTDFDEDAATVVGPAPEATPEPRLEYEFNETERAYKQIRQACDAIRKKYDLQELSFNFDFYLQGGVNKLNEDYPSDLEAVAETYVMPQEKIRDLSEKAINNLAQALKTLNEQGRDLSLLSIDYTNQPRRKGVVDQYAYTNHISTKGEVSLRLDASAEDIASLIESRAEEIREFEDLRGVEEGLLQNYPGLRLEYNKHAIDSAKAYKEYLELAEGIMVRLTVPGKVIEKIVIRYDHQGTGFKVWNMTGTRTTDPTTPAIELLGNDGQGPVGITAEQVIKELEDKGIDIKYINPDQHPGRPIEQKQPLPEVVDYEDIPESEFSPNKRHREYMADLRALAERYGISIDYSYLQKIRDGFQKDYGLDMTMAGYANIISKLEAGLALVPTEELSGASMEITNFGTGKYSYDPKKDKVTIGFSFSTSPSDIIAAFEHRQKVLAWERGGIPTTPEAPPTTPEKVDPISPEYDARLSVPDLHKNFKREFGDTFVVSITYPEKKQPYINQLVTELKAVKNLIPKRVRISIGAQGLPENGVNISKANYTIKVGRLTSRQVIIDALNEAQEEHWGTPEIIADPEQVRAVIEKIKKAILDTLAGEKLIGIEDTDLTNLILERLNFQDPKLVFQIRQLLRPMIQSIGK